MNEEAIEVLKQLADSESFIVSNEATGEISLDIDEERASVTKDVFDLLLEKKAVKKLADSDDEIYYIISADGKNMIFDA